LLIELAQCGGDGPELTNQITGLCELASRLEPVDRLGELTVGQVDHCLRTKIGDA